MIPLVALLFGFMLYLMNDIRRIGNRHSDDPLLIVESAKLYTRTASGHELVSCSGVIANTASALEATYIDLRADFYNSKEELIDTITEDSDLKIPRGSKTPFRVRGEADKPLSEYASCKVTTID